MIPMTPKDWRVKEGMTLEELSGKIGFSVGYLSEVENGLKDGSLRLIKAYQNISNGEVNAETFMSRVQ